MIIDELIHKLLAQYVRAEWHLRREDITGEKIFRPRIHMESKCLS